MAAYNFKPRFVLPIELRIKQQTIRAPRKDGWAPRRGMLIQHQTGPRMKPRRIGEGRILLVESIHMDLANNVLSTATVALVGSQHQELDAFARLDGFEDWADMKRWFWASAQGQAFQGVRIFWGETFSGPLDPPPPELAE